MSRNRATRKTSLGVLFWIAAILLIALVLMFSLPSIRQVLENTGFVEVVFEDRVPPQEDTRRTPAPPQPSPTDPGGTTPRETVTPDPADPLRTPEEPEGDRQDLPSDEEEQIVIPAPAPRDPEESPAERTTRATIFLIRVTDDGRIVAEAVPRTLSFTTSPLRRSIEALIEGPDSADHNRGLLTLVPAGTRLLGARIENGTAFLSFNDAFRFNPMGLEGHLAQLQQVVLTATAFPTVDSVQILIDGQVMDYLGGDGVYIGRPLFPTDW